MSSAYIQYEAKQEIIRGRHEAEAILCIALTSVPVCEVT
nr:MAG TPA: hypothetical protein [Caudoviricetes sp.]